MTRLESPVIDATDWEARARARKVRFIIKALAESLGKRKAVTPAALVAEAKTLTLEGRLMAEARAHQLMGTKRPKASSETTWSLVVDELESRLDESNE